MIVKLLLVHDCQIIFSVILTNNGYNNTAHLHCLVHCSNYRTTGKHPHIRPILTLSLLACPYGIVLAKHSILILEGIIKKISYERRDYESVDEKSLS